MAKGTACLELARSTMHRSGLAMWNEGLVRNSVHAKETETQLGQASTHFNRLNSRDEPSSLSVF
jgi:hypothetical protein